MVTVTVDGLTIDVPVGATVLEACDRAGRYVPRLCATPGSSGCARCLSSAAPAAPVVAAELGPPECGMCVVRRAGPDTVLACVTVAAAGMEITTDDPGLRAERLERLAPLLARHPQICLTCPDRDGCARDECRFGAPPEARCCDQFDRCEFGKLVGYLDPAGEVARRAVAAPRDATVEGRIRREPGLCVGCGRCVTICSPSPDAGDALEMRPETADTASAAGSARIASACVAAPRRETLRASGCSFCGQCVIVCPAGAITAVPGVEGQAWLEGRRKRYPHLAPVLPPTPWARLDDVTLSPVPTAAGVFQVADGEGHVRQISGCADLRGGLAEVVAQEAAKGVDAVALHFRFEVAPLYTERESELLAHFAQEHGHLPPGNDLGDDLFDADLFDDDLL